MIRRPPRSTLDRSSAASDVYKRQTTKLQSAAIGQFDGVGAGGPGSSIFGSADSRVNPWAFVLMLEGVTWFASSAARRLGETESKAAMPFTVFSSADGPIPGAVNEGARGELWAPVFAAVTAPHLTQIMREARAVWQGRAALRAAEMYGAVHTFGVDRGIDRFQRFGLLQRNGLAFVAVLLDTVEVSNRPTVSLAAAPIRRARGFDKAPGEATKRHTRVFDAAALNYLREPSPDCLLSLLAAQTTLELAATRSERSRADLRPPSRPARSSEVVEAVADVLAVSPEARVAAGLAATAAGGPAAGCLLYTSPSPRDRTRSRMPSSACKKNTKKKKKKRKKKKTAEPHNHRVPRQ